MNTQQPNQIWVAIHSGKSINISSYSNGMLTNCKMYVGEFGDPPLWIAAVQRNWPMVLNIAKTRKRRGLPIIVYRNTNIDVTYQIPRDVLFQCAIGAPDGHEALHFMLEHDLMTKDIRPNRHNVILAILSWLGKHKSVEFALSIIRGT